MNINKFCMNILLFAAGFCLLYANPITAQTSGNSGLVQTYSGQAPCALEHPLVKQGNNISGRYTGRCTNNRFSGTAIITAIDRNTPDDPIVYTVNYRDGTPFGVAKLDTGNGALIFTGTLRNWQPWLGYIEAFNEYNQPVRFGIVNGVDAPYNSIGNIPVFYSYVPPPERTTQVTNQIPNSQTCGITLPTDRYFITGIPADCGASGYSGNASLVLTPKDAREPTIQLKAPFRNGLLSGQVTATYPQIGTFYKGTFFNWRPLNGVSERPLGNALFEIKEYRNGAEVAVHQESRAATPLQVALVRAAEGAILQQTGKAIDKGVRELQERDERRERNRQIAQQQAYATQQQVTQSVQRTTTSNKNNATVQPNQFGLSAGQQTSNNSSSVPVFGGNTSPPTTSTILGQNGTDTIESGSYVSGAPLGQMVTQSTQQTSIFGGNTSPPATEQNTPTFGGNASPQAPIVSAQPPKDTGVPPPVRNEQPLPSPAPTLPPPVQLSNPLPAVTSSDSGNTPNPLPAPFSNGTIGTGQTDNSNVPAPYPSGNSSYTQTPSPSPQLQSLRYIDVMTSSELALSARLPYAYRAETQYSPEQIQQIKRDERWQNWINEANSILSPPSQPTRQVITPSTQQVQQNAQPPSPQVVGLTIDDRRWVSTLVPTLQRQIYSISPNRIDAMRASGRWNEIKRVFNQANSEILSADENAAREKIAIWEKAWTDTKTTVTNGALLLVPVERIAVAVIDMGRVARGAKIFADTPRGVGATGIIGENYLKTLGGRSQVSFNTERGLRVVDQVVGRIGYEAKTGYQSLTSEIAEQIVKDKLLLRNGELSQIAWHFFRSPITGQIGPSAPLRRELENAGIQIVLHSTP